MSPQFFTPTPCPKCGAATIDVSYDKQTDMMKLKCLRCGFQWKEKPLKKG